ncbi:hypothetical protein D9M72_483580 [compost metagenome]
MRLCQAQGHSGFGRTLAAGFLRPALEHRAVFVSVPFEDGHLPLVLHGNRSQLHLHPYLIGVVGKLVQDLSPWNASGHALEVHERVPDFVDWSDYGESAVYLH